MKMTVKQAVERSIRFKLPDWQYEKMLKEAMSQKKNIKRIIEAYDKSENFQVMARKMGYPEMTKARNAFNWAVKQIGQNVWVILLEEDYPLKLEPKIELGKLVASIGIRRRVKVSEIKNAIDAFPREEAKFAKSWLLGEGEYESSDIPSEINMFLKRNIVVNLATKLEII